MKTPGLHSHALLYGHASVGQMRSVFVSPERRKIKVSPPSRQVRLAQVRVSFALPGHSSQPLSDCRARERTFGGMGGA